MHLELQCNINGGVNNFNEVFRESLKTYSKEIKSKPSNWVDDWIITINIDDICSFSLTLKKVFKLNDLSIDAWEILLKDGDRIKEIITNFLDYFFGQDSDFKNKKLINFSELNHQWKWLPISKKESATSKDDISVDDIPF